jgi:hypothetical protein
MGKGFFQDCGRDRIARLNQAVVHPSSLAPSGDETRAPKISQMPRYLRLAHPQDIHKIANANFIVGDQIEKTKARAIRHGSKEKVDGERFILAGHDNYYIWLDRYEQGGLRSSHTHKRIYCFEWEALCQRIPSKPARRI